MSTVRRNPDTSTLLLVGLGLYVFWRYHGTLGQLVSGGAAAAGPVPPSYSGWPSGFGQYQPPPPVAQEGQPCTTTTGRPGVWRRVTFGAVRVGGIPQQFVCWPRGVPAPL